MRNPFEDAEREAQALGTAVAVKAAIDNAVARGLALHADSEDEEPPPVPSFMQGMNYTPDSYWTLMRLPVTDPTKQYYWVPTPLAMSLKSQIIDKPFRPTPRRYREPTGYGRRIGCFAVFLLVLFVLWVTGALASMGLAPKAGLETVFEGVAKPGPVTGCRAATSKDNVRVELTLQEAAGRVTGKLTSRTHQTSGWSDPFTETRSNST